MEQKISCIDNDAFQLKISKFLLLHPSLLEPIAYQPLRGHVNDVVVQIGQVVHPEVGMDEALASGRDQEVDMITVLLAVVVFGRLLCDEEETFPILELLSAAEEDMRVDLALEKVVRAEDGGSIIGLQPLDVEGGVQSLVVEVERLDISLESKLSVTGGGALRKNEQIMRKC